MKDTNAIEEALRVKCKQEISNVVEVFINELEVKIRGEYGGYANYYEFKPPTSNKNFSIRGTEQIRNVLFRMISSTHLEGMIKVKSKELIKKLELI